MHVGESVGVLAAAGALATHRGLTLKTAAQAPLDLGHRCADALGLYTSFKLKSRWANRSAY